MEFKIINEDKPGYIKEIGGVFGDLKINITYLVSKTDYRRKFSTVTVRCDPITETKVEKLLVRIKKIKGTKEVTCKHIR